MSKELDRCGICLSDYCGRCIGYDTSCSACGQDTCGEPPCAADCAECCNLICKDCESEHSATSCLEIESEEETDEDARNG